MPPKTPKINLPLSSTRSQLSPSIINLNTLNVSTPPSRRLLVLPSKSPTQRILNGSFNLPASSQINILNTSTPPPIVRIENVFLSPVPPNRKANKRKIDFDNEQENIEPLAKRKCRCGSTDHKYISHHTCRMNPKNNEISIFNAPFVNSNVRPCKCGSYEHSKANHKSCQFYKPHLKCQCGSTSHKTTKHADCPLNSKKNCIDRSIEIHLTNLITQTQNPLLIQARETLRNSQNLDENLFPLLRVNV